MKIFLLALRNLRRNRLRTFLTVLGAAVAILAFVSLRTVLSSWSAASDFAAKDRIATRHKVSFIISMPKRYADDIIDLLERLNTEFKKTILMVTHDPQVAQRARITRKLDKGQLQ